MGENMNLKSKRILVIGGSGSVGEAVIRLLLNYDPKEIIVFSRDEYRQCRMNLSFQKEDNVCFVLGDIKDYNSIRYAMQDINIVIHLAALKHIGKCEENPIEAVKNNVVGSLNVLEAALDSKPEKVLAMSTDKACNPIGVYGKTKSLMEDLFLSGNDKYTRFSCMRCGNILDSSGSITELFRKFVIEGKRIKITDESMTRFWVTLKQIGQFIIKSIDMMEGGEIFIPKMGSCSIKTLADIFSDRQEIIGIRKGERVHEILITEKEGDYCQEKEDRFIIINKCQNEKRGFEYRSDTNLWQLTEQDLKIMLGL